LYQCPISLDVFLVKVAEHPSTMADEFEQPAPRMVILTMLPEVIGDLADTVRGNCNLDFC